MARANYLPDASHDHVHTLQTYARLCDVCAIQAIDAICSEDTSLHGKTVCGPARRFLRLATIVEAQPSKEAESLLNHGNLIRELV